MAKPSSFSDSDNTTSYNTVFVDTSLDTHLAMIVSDSETVSELKKKIMYEHPLCFPKTGDIKIHALKVKRKGHLYHLSDSMFVKSAFGGVSKSWFLYVDASTTEEHTDNQQPPAQGIEVLSDGPIKKSSSVLITSLLLGRSDQHVKQNPIHDQFCLSDSNGEVLKDMEMEVEHTVDGHCEASFPEKNNTLDPKIRDKYDISSKEYDVPEKHVQCEDHHAVNMEGTVVAEESNNVQNNVRVSRDESVDRLTADQTGKVEDEKELSPNDKPKANPVSKSGKGSKNRKKFQKDQDTVGAISLASIAEHAEGSLSAVSLNEATKGVDGHCEVSFPEKSNTLDPKIHGNYDVNSKEHDVPGKHVECEDHHAVDLEGAVVAKESNNVKDNVRVSRDESVDRLRADQTGKVEDEKELSTSDKQKANPVLKSGKGSKKRKKSRKDQDTVGEISLASMAEQAEDSLSAISLNAATNGVDGHCEVSFPKKNNTLDPKIHDKYDPNSKEYDIPGEHAECKDDHAVDMEGVVVAKESNNVRDNVRVSRDESVDSLTADQTGKVEDEKELSPSDKPKTNPVSKSGKGSKKRKKSQKDQDTVGDISLASIADQDEGSLSAVSLNEAPKAANDNHPIDEAVKTEGILCPKEVSKIITATDKETDKVIQNVLESLQQINEDPENAEIMDRMLRKEGTEKQKLSNKDDVVSNAKEEVVTSAGLVDAKTNVELEKSSKKRKKSKRAQDSAKDGKHGEVSGGAIASDEAPKAVDDHHSSDEATKKETGLCPPEGIANDKEANVMIGENPAQVENVGEKSRKKTKKRQRTTEKELLELPMKDEDINPKDPFLSTDNVREVNVSSELTNKTGLGDTSSKDQLNGSNMGPESNSGIKINSLPNELPSLLVRSSQSPLQTPNYPNEANKIVHQQLQDENVVSPKLLVDDVSGAKLAASEVKTKKKKKKRDAHGDSSSSVIQSKVKLNENWESEGKAKAGNSSSTQLERSLPKNETDSLLLYPKKMLPEVCRSDASPDVNPTSGEPGGPIVVDASRTSYPSKKVKEAHGESNMRLKSKKIQQNKIDNKQSSHLDHNHVALRKFSVNKIGEVVNSSQHEKSLLVRSGTIFKDDSAEDSEAEDGVDSDATTRTPADNSLSSDYSDGGSYSNFNSPKNAGSYGSKEKEGVRSKDPRSCSSGLKGMTLDTILRSSSRYKKAKLTASQSQPEDAESQPVEFVPDSQANP